MSLTSESVFTSDDLLILRMRNLRLLQPRLCLAANDLKDLLVNGRDQTSRIWERSYCIRREERKFATEDKKEDTSAAAESQFEPDYKDPEDTDANRLFCSYMTELQKSDRMEGQACSAML